MKIQCQSCQAKYTIADEKVLGKVVKIRCKKCSATIVINGNETRPAEDNADTNVFDYAGQANDQWTVNVADGDQRTMTAPEIVAEYRSGVVNDETYCWKDGMADWLPLREIEQLYGLAKLGQGRAPQPSLHEDISLAPQSVPPPNQVGAGGAGLFSSAADAGSVESPFAGGGSNGNGHYGEPAAAAPVAAAARRGGGRGQGADLFGNVASAGGEEDVMTSAIAGGAAAAAAVGGGAAVEDHKLTGQRNESSVLFSLSALTEGGKSEPAPNRTTATSDGSGLIDIRALSQNMGSDDKKAANTRVDDIMNLSGGGAFGAALAAPILAPPPMEMMPDYQQGGDSGKSSKMLFIAIISGAAIIALGIVGAVFVLRPAPVQPIDATNPAGAFSGAALAGTASAAAAAGGAGAAADPGAAGSGSALADNTPPPPGTGNATGKPGPNAGTPGTPGTPAKPGTGPAIAAAPKDTGAVAAVTPPPPKTPEPAKDLASALATAAGKKDEPPKDTGGGGSSAPFDRGAASAALGGVSVQSCKKGDGPTGAGHVKITFAPNGTVSSAVVDSGPFPGTAVGGCIAGKFRGAHVPPFSGGPVSVGKSFAIN
jgi:predicted Zn finger-like uncharacterized protein